MAETSPQVKEWYALRRKAIHEKVECHEILRRNGFGFKHTSDREEQFSCPFHGKDEKPSARVYPSNPQSRSHVYCFVCKPSPSWDAIALWKKFSGEDKGHHAILSEIEKAFGIEVPPMPEGSALPKQPSIDEAKQAELERLLEACEVRLLDAREDYRQLGDMSGYLVAGSILDKVTSQIGQGDLNFSEGLVILQKLRQKIGERIRCQER